MLHNADSRKIGCFARLLRNYRQDRRGVAMIEYALIASIMSLGVMVGMADMSDNVGESFEGLGAAIVGSIDDSASNNNADDSGDNDKKKKDKKDKKPKKDKKEKQSKKDKNPGKGKKMARA